MSDASIMGFFCDVCDTVEISQNYKIGNYNTIEGRVSIGKNVKIGNGNTISGDIQIGDNCIIGNNVSIVGNVKIGDSNHIFSNVCIGYEAQHLAKIEVDTLRSIIIGNQNTFRENCTVHMPHEDNSLTTIGHNSLFMVNSHISHDTNIGDSVVICNNVAIGGHSQVGDFACIGLNSSVHQFCKIGQYSMIGMGSAITKDVLPFYLISHTNGIKTSVNVVGIKRNYKGDISIKEIKKTKKYISDNRTVCKSTDNKELQSILSNFTSASKSIYY
jgi:UDP-N-acetylglucosamine acyltransferase